MRGNESAVFALGGARAACGRARVIIVGHTVTVVGGECWNPPHHRRATREATTVAVATAS